MLVNIDWFYAPFVFKIPVWDGEYNKMGGLIFWWGDYKVIGGGHLLEAENFSEERFIKILVKWEDPPSPLP